MVGTTRRGALMVAGAILALVSGSACMMGPYDKEKVANTTQPIEFWGFHLAGSSEVRIEAFDSQINTWKTIDITHSVDWPLQSKWGNDAYYWSKNVVVPPQYWKPAIIGKGARVRAMTGPYSLMSVNEDVGPCYWGSETMMEFAGNCAAPESPVARLYTDKYVGVDSGCTTQGAQLIDLVNAYRIANQLAPIKPSPSLCAVGQAHVIDLGDNHPDVGECNLHSWSNKGIWSACCYTSSNPNNQCMWGKPDQLTDYTGYGYENAAGGVFTPQQALAAWKSSPAHNDVILNKGPWTNYKWGALGAGLYDGYATLWFGVEADPAATAAQRVAEDPTGGLAKLIEEIELQ